MIITRRRTGFRTKRKKNETKLYSTCILHVGLFVHIVTLNITTYSSGTELGSPCLKLSDRCKHVYAVVHVDLLYTVKHSTENTT